MACERVAGLLPWLMNGTLDGSERQLVREHLAECPRCQRELAEMSFAWSVYQQHIPTEKLINLAYDRPLIAAERKLFDRHLSDCADCVEQLDMVKESRRLEAEEEEETPQVVPPTAGRAVWWQRVPAWRYGTLAASLLLVIAVGGWLRSWQQARRLQADRSAQEQALRGRLAGLEAETERLRQAEAQLNRQHQQSDRELAELRAQIKEAQTRIQRQNQTPRELAQAREPALRPGAPQINVLAIDIYPSGMTQRDVSSSRNELVIPRNVRALTLILNSQAAADFQSYSIEIVSARGKVVWRARGLQRNPTNDYTISVAADYLAPGDYTIIIHGTAAGQRVRVESYQLNVRKL